LAATTISERAFLAQEIRRQDLDRRVGQRARMARMVCGEMLGAAVGEIVAIDRGDHDMGEPELEGRFRDMFRLSASSAPGMPVLTLQKAQARVQVSPMIMKVACFLSQHSPMFGQPASSHTVTRASDANSEPIQDPTMPIRMLVKIPWRDAQ
jgi:hypothetical protein